jgi:hypothetical protein
MNLPILSQIFFFSFLFRRINEPLNSFSIKSSNLIDFVIKTGTFIPNSSSASLKLIVEKERLILDA